MIEHKLKIHADFPLLPYKLLHAGNLTCIYESGNLRYINCGNTEIIRMIYPAVRDKSWGTIVPQISDEVIEENQDSYNISYTATYQSGSIHFAASIKINFGKNDTVSFSFDGQAMSDFEKNRIGICILHPIKECAGKEVIITEPGGTLQKGIFPELISPHQPFINIQQLKWQPDAEIDADIKMTGDIFETEDQRNWGDNSFKTYGTPLEIPFPASIKKGDSVKQQVLLTVTTKNKRTHFPKIGIRKNHDQALPVSKILAGEAEIHHHRVEIYLFQAGWELKLSNAAKVEAKLELIVFFDNNYTLLDDFVDHISTITDSIYTILLLDKNTEVTPPDLMELGYSSIKSKFPAIPVGYGTDGYFANINRTRPGNLPHDFISFSLHPQVHATDTRTIIENIEGYPAMIKTARSFTNKPVHVSPVTINDRNVPGSNQNDSREAQTSSHMQSDFIKRWTGLCLEHLSEADSVTF